MGLYEKNIKYCHIMEYDETNVGMIRDYVEYLRSQEDAATNYISYLDRVLY